MNDETVLNEEELGAILNSPEHKDLIDELVEFVYSTKSAAMLSNVIAEYTSLPPRLVASALKYVIFPLLKKSGKVSLGIIGKKAKQTILKLDYCQKIIKYILDKDRLQEWANKTKNCKNISITPEDFAKLDYRQALEDISDAIDNLTIGQAELKDLIAELQEHISKKLEYLSPSIPVIRVETSADNPFVYSARQIPYQKRALETQLREAEEFVSCDKTFTWHVVSGEGGTGKSRFIWELFERHGVEFCGGFLEKGTTFNWHSWKPSEPTLIAIDYAGEYPKKARTLLSALIGNKESYKYPVRVVLIEREGQINFDEDTGIPEWLKGVFKVEKTIKQAMKDTYFNESKNAISLNSQYKDEDNHNDDIWEIIQTFAEGCRLDKVATLKEFASIDPKKRPLFAAFYGDAKKDGKDVKNWNSAELVGCVISTNRNKYWSKACGKKLDHDMRALSIATLSGELDLSSSELPEIIHKVCPKLSKLSSSSKRMQALGGNYDANKLSALEPDIIGELFVLQTLFTESSRPKKNDREALMTALWNSFPVGVANYFYRAFDDFHDDSRLRELFDSADLSSLEQDARYLWCICSAKVPSTTEDIKHYLSVAMSNTEITPTELVNIFTSTLRHYSALGYQLETEIEELTEVLPEEVKNQIITQKEYYLNFAAFFGVLEFATYLLKFFDKDSVYFENENGAFPLLMAAQNGHAEVVKELINADGIEVNKENKTNGTFPLLMAALNGHAEVVKELINADGIEVNKVDSIDRTFPLLMAAQNGHAEVVKELINADGIEVNKAHENGAFPLLMAAQNGHAEVVKELINADGIEVNKENKTSGTFPLLMAAQNGHAEVVKELINADGIEVNKENKTNGTFPLLMAALNGHIEVVKELINADGIEVNKENKTSGTFPLLMAAQNGHIEVVKELINADGIEVNKAHENGIFPLLMAALNGHAEVVKELINADGIEVNKENKTNGTFPLLMAAQNGHIEVVKELINADGIEVNKVDSIDRTFPLLMAAQNGHIEVVKELINADGIEVNKAHENGAFPLLMAAQNGHIEVVKELINADGIEVNKENKTSGTFPLLMAALNGHAEVVKELINADGIEVNKVDSIDRTFPLLMAAQNGHIEVVKELINADGIEVNKAHENGTFPLLMAAQNGHIEVVKELINADGIEVNKAHENGIFPLLMAALNGHAEVVKELINADGIEVNKAHENGAFPLLMAALDGHIEVVKELINADGIEVNKVDSIDRTFPLLMAAQNGHAEVVKELINADGIEVNKAHENGAFPLLMAAQNGHAEVVKELINADGIEVNKAHENGAFPLLMAAQNGHAEVVKELINADGIEVNKVDSIDRTFPLLMAAQNGHAEVVKELINADGIEVNKVDSIDRTFPLLMAAQNGHIEVVKELINADGIEVNKAHENGTFPLLMAAQNGHAEVVKELINADGIEVNKVDSIDRTFPLLMAAQNGHIEVVKKLINADGIEVNKVDSETTASSLLLAILIGNFEITELLLQHGANLDIYIEKAQMTVYEYAIDQDTDTTIIELLNKYRKK